jgi:RNA polymerase sigma factor (sigma-70 family)
MSDTAVRIADADDQWDVLVRRHGPMMASIARGYGLGAADVADVVQTVWMKLFEHVDQIREPERIRSWLATTTRRECLGVLRQCRRITLVPDSDRLEFVADDAVEPRVENLDRDVQLRATVANLSDIQRAIVSRLMSDVEPSYSQVATELGIPIGSIGPTRRRSLKVLHARCVGAGLHPG